jgi:dTDP-4-amino-4,6-dideoxygalactose transaminase
MGLLQLKSLSENIKKRELVTNKYRELLKDVLGISVMPEPTDTKSNYSYFPIFIDEKKYGMSRDNLYDKLKDNNIYSRRYFYPLISEFSMYKGLESANPSNLPIAEKMANSVICLPIYSELDLETVEKICSIINK